MVRLRAILLVSLLLGACAPKEEPAPPPSEASAAGGSESGASGEDDSSSEESGNAFIESAGDDEPTPDETAPITYESKLEFGDLLFELKAYGETNRKLLVARASRGGKAVGDPGRAVIDGDVVSAAAADLDADESPDLLVFARGRGPNRVGSFVGLSFVGEVFEDVTLPSLTREQAAGYRGGDVFSFDATHIVRKFPVFEGKGEAPTARTRTITYTLSGGSLAVDAVRE